MRFLLQLALCVGLILAAGFLRRAEAGPPRAYHPTALPVAYVDACDCGKTCRCPIGDCATLGGCVAAPVAVPAPAATVVYYSEPARYLPIRYVVAPQTFYGGGGCVGGSCSRR